VTPEDDEFSLDSLLKEKEEMELRQQERARLAAALAENIEEYVHDPSIDAAVVEKTFGKGASEAVKAVIEGEKGESRTCGGFRFFGWVGKEREFDRKWIEGIDWLDRFDGESFSWCVRLIVDEATRNGLVECGFIKDMIGVCGKLPSELLLWIFEHGISCTLI
jgi:hypothetical protein